MSDAEYKTFQIKNIPTDDWNNFKIKHIKKGTGSLNDTMLKLIRAYGKGSLEQNING